MLGAGSRPDHTVVDGSLQGVRAYMQQSRIFVGMVLILIFGEVLGLYGFVPRTPSNVGSDANATDATA
jgi:hypothetical protein